MTLLDHLREVRKSPAVAYFEFILKNPKSTNSVHAFFEGRSDGSFYTNFLQPWVSALETYWCGGKQQVYKTHRKIMQRGKPQNHVLFFVDRDFSDLIGNSDPEYPEVYITDHYSIENYVVSQHMLRRVWNELFRFTPEHLAPEWNSSIEHAFETALGQFYAGMRPITAGIIVLQRRGLKMDLDEKKLAALFSFSDGDDLTLDCDVDQDRTVFLEKLCNIAIPAEAMSEAEVEDVQHTLCTLPAKRYIRGKFELWFFVQFIEKLLRVLRRQIASDGTKVTVKCSWQIGKDNAMDVLGPRAIIPLSLQTFLNARIGSATFPARAT